MNGLRWGRVAAVHPEDYSLDLVMTDTGEQMAGVQVLTPHASTNSGYASLPNPATPPSGNKWDLTTATSRDVLAAVASFGPYAVVIGFRYPQICQMLFADLDRVVNRTPSDFYTTTDSSGNFEAYHPSGTYFRIGSSSAHEDLTGKDFDGQWAIAKNTGAAVHAHLTVANAGAAVASIDIDPSGSVTISHNGNMSVTTNGTTYVKSTSVTIDTPTTHVTGAMTVDGALTFKGGMSGSGGTGGATMTLVGSVAVTGGEVTVDGIGVKGHHHTAQGSNSPTTVSQA
jgi:phage baseplate assembly protein gpV